MNHIGVDVSSKELSVVMSVNGRHSRVQLFENKAEDHQRLIAGIKKLSGETIVCMEATGIHHFDLAVTLSRVESINRPLKNYLCCRCGVKNRLKMLIY
jgi:transposase